MSLGAFSLTSENSSPFITRGVSIKEENNVSTEAAVHVASPLSSTELSKLVLVSDRHAFEELLATCGYAIMKTGFSLMLRYV